MKRLAIGVLFVIFVAGMAHAWPAKAGDEVWWYSYDGHKILGLLDHKDGSI